jgi:hypothetical protein
MRPTTINGISADLLAPTPAPKEDHDKRHKFCSEPGTAAEAIANMSRFFPVQEVAA